MSRPPISVIMPVRGAGLFLAEALRSLTIQSLSIGELLVVDDGMDDTATSALSTYADLNPVVLQGGGKGPAAARNIGLSAATGDFVGFLDDDDIWPRDKLSVQLARLCRYPEESAVGGRIIWFSDWDHALDAPADTPGVQSVVHVNLGAFLFRRGVFARIGFFDETHIYSEDVDFILRMSDASEQFMILDHPTLYYRRHGGSMTARIGEAEKLDFRRAVFRSLKRRPRDAMAGLSLTDRLVSPTTGLSE
jgi:glycosyltransferase involved in cell wall biosynthesis